ncbi:hypothetical protein GCM10025865_17580 [Paraoerskovia sediminicola]|uniref:Uncharacterized protein n=1 Tax=Paraoerskovia sediminicola TaxID=1138587 RepID=A0ABN6XCE9_9CELL|nr:hypothetical protein GCM10025865_17580 [Paraoerskovia sediminicola]
MRAATKRGRPPVAVQTDTTLRWLLDGPPRTHDARRRSLAAAIRAETGATQAPRALITDLLAAAEAVARPESASQVRRLRGPLAPHARHSLVEANGARRRLATWDLDF